MSDQRCPGCGSLHLHPVEVVECCEREIVRLRELLVSAEGYAIASGADLPFVRMFVEGTPKAEAIERAGCYPRDARREHPGRFALNPPPTEATSPGDPPVSVTRDATSATQEGTQR